VVLASVDEGSPLFSPIKALHKLGYFPIGFYESAKALLLTAILFIGPLFEAGIAEGKWRDWIRLRGLNACIRGWIGYRNYVAVSEPPLRIQA
jgi:prenyl protein peptidase